MLKLDLYIYGQDLKINLLYKLKNIFLRKSFFVFLVLCLSVLTVVMVKESGKVKGDSTSPYVSVIWDENKKVIVKSTSFEPKDVFTENSIKVYPEDNISVNLILDPVKDGGVGQKISIKRTPVYNVSVDGKTIPIRTWEPVAGEIVKKAKVTLGAKDKLSFSKSALLLPGETIVITRIKEADVAEYEDVPFATIERGDSGISFGDTKIINEGITGKIKKIYHVVYKNGKEVSRVLKSQKTVIARQDKVIGRGIMTGRANFGYYSGMVTSFFMGMTGRHLLVTNLANGRSVKVEIIGSGPFNGPLMDMGTAPFQAIGGRLSDGYLPSVSVQLLD